MWSGVAYLIAALICFVLGFPIGSQHRTLGGALVRAAVEASVWALGVLTVVHLVGGEPATALPSPEWTYLLYAIVPTCVAAAISWTIGRRRRA
ncbi:hypothetical protein [Janibacter sp. G56]|uniref:hypothetical protein n=1 Tax=Janibacter sp. G56 TaxID=3418717 RepID=UPI003D077E67